MFLFSALFRLLKFIYAVFWITKPVSFNLSFFSLHLYDNLLPSPLFHLAFISSCFPPSSFPSFMDVMLGLHCSLWMVRGAQAQEQGIGKVSKGRHERSGPQKHHQCGNSRQQNSCKDHSASINDFKYTAKPILQPIQQKCLPKKSKGLFRKSLIIRRNK